MDNYTPKFDGKRVRIPVSNRTFTIKGDVVTIKAGLYPVVENGAEVTESTPRVRLAGRYRHKRTACGLGCRCDARIVKVIRG